MAATAKPLADIIRMIALDATRPELNPFLVVAKKICMTLLLNALVSGHRQDPELGGPSLSGDPDLGGPPVAMGGLGSLRFIGKMVWAVRFELTIPCPQNRCVSHYATPRKEAIIELAVRLLMGLLCY